MSEPRTPETILTARVAVDEAEAALRKAVRANCPRGVMHKPVQHRDAKPAWCPDCGFGDDGFAWRDMPGRFDR